MSEKIVYTANAHGAEPILHCGIEAAKAIKIIVDGALLDNEIELRGHGGHVLLRVTNVLFERADA